MIANIFDKSKTTWEVEWKISGSDSLKRWEHGTKSTENLIWTRTRGDLIFLREDWKDGITCRYICWSSRREFMDFQPDGLRFLSDIGKMVWRDGRIGFRSLECRNGLDLELREIGKDLQLRRMGNKKLVGQLWGSNREWKTWIASGCVILSRSEHYLLCPLEWKRKKLSSVLHYSSLS